MIHGTPETGVQRTFFQESNRILWTPGNDFLLAVHEWVSRAFGLYGGCATMARKHLRIHWKGIDLLANRFLQDLEIAPGKVGAADAAGKESITHKRGASARKIEQHVARAVSRHMPDFDFEAKDGQPFAGLQPPIDVNGLKIHSLTHEPLHDFRRFDHLAISRMSRHPRLRLPNHLRSALRVIPMAVRDPKFG